MELTELNLSEEQLTGVNTYLESQLQAKIQSEGDKIRTKYNNEITGYKTKITDYDKTIEELTAKIPVTKSEKEIEFENMMKSLQDEKNQLEKEKFQLNVQKQLKDKGLNQQLHKFLNVEGVEDLETYLTELTELVTKSNNTYKPKSHTQQTTITKADFKNMDYDQRLDLYSTNRELFNSLNN